MVSFKGSQVDISSFASVVTMKDGVMGGGKHWLDPAVVRINSAHIIRITKKLTGHRK